MKTIKNILIISLLTAILLEITLQLNYYIQNGALLFYRVNTPIYIKDINYAFRVKSYLTYHHKTNEFNVIYYTNSKGLRCSSKFEEYGNPGNELEIILNGPSFAFGWGVNYEQSFAAILKKKLELNSPNGKRGLKVINFGVPSRPVPVQIKYLKNESRHYNPSLVVQLVYGSMVVCDDEQSYYSAKDGYLVNKKDRYQYIISKLKQSGIIFYSWIAYNKILSWSNKNNSNKKIIGAGRELKNIYEFNLENKDIITSLNYYLNLQSYCQSINAKLIIVYIPLSYIIYNEDIIRWRHLGADNIKGQIAFNHQFCNYLKTHGIVCIDLTEDLSKIAKNSPQRLYYWLDVHWTAYGNEVAAGLVADYLLKHHQEYF